MTIDEIVKKAGDGSNFAAGAKAIAAKFPDVLKAETIYKWPKIGIPDRYWPEIIELTSVTPEQLYSANVAARAAVSV